MIEKVAAIIQARMGSSRLPGKVMADVIGRPMLAHVCERVSACPLVDEVIVATTCRHEDQTIVRFCLHEGWTVFRGSAEDVLDRYYQAATAADAQIVVRITADCPLVDAGLVAEIVEPMRVPGGVDYVSNVFPRRTYPRGLDAEALRIGVLRRLWMTAREPEAREHVTLTVHRDALRYRIRSVTSPTDHSHLRWTVDTADDLRLVRAVFEHFGHNRMDWSDVVRAFDGNPQWCGLNKHVVQKVA